MAQIFRVDFSLSSRRFELLDVYNAKSWRPAGKFFSVQLDKRVAISRFKIILDCVLGESASFAVRFCDVAEMQEMNRRFRGKNKPTDVLSFCRSANLPFEEVRELGDILICLPVCLVQAKRARISLSEEVERMVIHGLTHLLGYDHERSEMAWKIQEAVEKNLRKEISRRLGKPTWCEVRK